MMPPDQREVAVRPASEPTDTAMVLDVTDQFYAWERRGRGWWLYPKPVCLEPGFIPFFFHGLAENPPGDSGRRPTLLSALSDRVMNWLSSRSAAPSEAAPPNFASVAEDEPDAYEAQGIEEPICELQIALPPAFKVALGSVEQFLFALSSCHYPVGFEIIGQSDVIAVQLACRRPDVSHVRQELAAYFPEAVVGEEKGFLARAWEMNSDSYTFVVDLGLSEEFMLPLRIARGLEVDPLNGLIGALTDLAPGELAAYQVLFEPVRHPWAESVWRSVTDGRGGSFFADAPQMLPLTREKISVLTTN